MKTAIYFFLASLFLFLGACTSKKKLPSSSLESSCEYKEIQLSQLKSFSPQDTPQWYKAKGKASVTFKDENYELDIQIRMKTKELLWLSVTKSSFPIAKILLTTDSVFFVDIFNQQYLKTDYPSIGKKFGINCSFESVQNIFLGQSIMFKDKIFQWTSGENIVLSNVSKNNTEKPSSDSNFLVFAQWVNCKTLEINKQLFRSNAKNEDLWIAFEKFKEEDFINYPSLISITALQKNVRKLFCTFEMISFKRSETLNIPFDIPSNYVELQ